MKFWKNRIFTFIGIFPSLFTIAILCLSVLIFLLNLIPSNFQFLKLREVIELILILSTVYLMIVMNSNKRKIIFISVLSCLFFFSFFSIVR